MFVKTSRGLRDAIAAALVCSALGATPALAQTAFGSSTAIVFPVVASTASFTSTLTLFNPNGASITVHLDYFEANNLGAPGAKPCNDVVVPANGSVAFTLPAQCTLDAGSHFGPLVATDAAGTNEFFGYSRTENTASAGFSIEGFPSENFASDTTNVTGLRGSTSPAPAFTSNCFVTALTDPITYAVRLFDGPSGAQIGSTLTGSLNAFEQYRYTDVFALTGAPAATNFANVRAEFERTSSDGQMAAFCTVQDNASLGADFRIAKALTPVVAPPPPPPLGDMTLAGTWSGSIPAVLNGLPLAFIGATTQVTLASTTGLSAYGGGWFAKQSAGSGSLKLGVCYQDQNGPGAITLMGTTTTYSVGSSQAFKAAAGSAASVPAATYKVGLCGQNIGANSINKNNHSSGVVFVGS